MTTRFYDPETGRFISQDEYTYLDPDSVNGLNLFAYCANNPMMMTDENGTSPKWWQWLLFGIGAALVAAAAVVLTVTSGGVATGLIGTIAVGAAKGALIGAAVGSAVGIAGGAIYAGVTGANIGESILSGFLMGFGAGAIIGAVVGGSVGAFQYTSAVRHWGATTSRTAQKNMIHHFDKHVIKEGHKYLGKNVVQYTRNARELFKTNSSLIKLTKSGNYAIRAVFAGQKAGGFFNAAGLIFSFF